MATKTETFDHSGCLTDFELKEADLVGKQILDISAGARLFACDCLANGAASVISLDCDSDGWVPVKRWAEKRLAQNKNHVDAQNWLAVSQKSVEANTARLPFPDNSFDLILGRLVIPQMLKSEADTISAFLEIKRVLAPGGQARLSPLNYWETEIITAVNHAFILLNGFSDFQIETKTIVFHETRRPSLMLIIKKLA